MNFWQRSLLRVVRKLSGSEGEDKRINWWKTLYFNFRTMPFAQAKRLPVYIYGKVSFITLDGEVQIEGDIKPGMIKMGINVDLFSGRNTALICLGPQSRITFRGEARIDVNYIIRLSPGAHLEVGNSVILGSNVKICCSNRISIDDFSGVSFESQVIDTNFHYLLNCEDGSVRRASTPVHIGKYNWIGNRCTIMRGTRTPDFTIVGSNSLLNKNYDVPEMTNGGMLAGCPACIRSTKKTRRITNDQYETMLNAFFDKHQDTSVYRYEDWEDIPLFSPASEFEKAGYRN